MLRGAESSRNAVSAPFAARATNLEVVYGKRSLALRGVSVDVPAGRVVALLGANGSGKTTLLRTLSGLLDMHDARITRGTVERLSVESGPDRPSDVVASGISHVMEGRRVFGVMSVRENLVAGGYLLRGGAALRSAQDEVLDLFPVLRRRLNQRAGYLSGGEQQMLAIARALMQRPRLLLLDEPSLGLAPMVADQIAASIRSVNVEMGTSVLLVEQDAPMALSIAHNGYVLSNGRVVADGTPDELHRDRDVRELFLGLDGGARRSYRDAKTYHRKARWAS